MPDPISSLKAAVARLDERKPDWWIPRGEAAAYALQYPHTSSPDEWGNALLALDQFTVEGFRDDKLRDWLTGAGKRFEKEWRSLRLLQDCLVEKGLGQAEAIETLKALKRIHTLRSQVKGYLAESKRDAIIKQVYSDHGSLAEHFRKLAEDVQSSFDRIIGVL